MKDKKKFMDAVKTLLFSWGSDAPAEVVWGLNEMVEWLETEHNIKIDGRFEEYCELAHEPMLKELESKL